MRKELCIGADIMYGKIIDGVFHIAPETYEFSNGFIVDNFNNDIALLTELGYKEVVKYDAPEDVRFKYIYTYEEKDGKIYEYRELDDSEDVLDELKKRAIAKTKEDLALYLEQNPLMSSCKGGVEKVYTVTMDKQNQLTATVADYLSNALPSLLAGIPFEEIDIPIYWNAKGETCEEWTYQEIYQLKNEMMAYVRPIVEYQRYLEKNIMDAETQDVILNMDIYYNSDKIERFSNI